MVLSGLLVLCSRDAEFVNSSCSDGTDIAPASEPDGPSLFQGFGKQRNFDQIVTA